MEINYLTIFNRNLEDDNRDLYPSDWYTIEDYSKKTDILIEAVSNKLKIEDTEGYQKIIEGVRSI